MLRPHPSGKGWCSDRPYFRGADGLHYWPVASLDASWLGPLLAALPRNHGLPFAMPPRAGIGPNAEDWRLVAEGHFQVARMAGANTSRPGRARWHPTSWGLALGPGLLVFASHSGSGVPRTDERMSRTTAESLLQGLDALRTDPLGVLGPRGIESGKCGVCRRALTDAQSKLRGLGPDCLALLNPALSSVVQ
jgi:hypothetical protein